MYQVEQIEDDINDLLNKCADAEEQGTTQARGMTYEQGVKAGIEWLTMKQAPYPLAE